MPPWRATEVETSLGSQPRTEAESETRLEEIPETECRQLLGQHSLGRVPIVVEGKPQVFPVNYAIDDRVIVFRTARHQARVCSDVACRIRDRRLRRIQPRRLGRHGEGHSPRDHRRRGQLFASRAHAAVRSDGAWGKRSTGWQSPTRSLADGSGRVPRPKSLEVVWRQRVTYPEACGTERQTVESISPAPTAARDAHIAPCRLARLQAAEGCHAGGASRTGKQSGRSTRTLVRTVPQRAGPLALIVQTGTRHHPAVDVAAERLIEEPFSSVLEALLQGPSQCCRDWRATPASA
jgi:Pyridoxamine 5'-phosphate oxidase